MSSRRSRIVVKPNIRPSAAKIAPKAKQTPSSKADEQTKALSAPTKSQEKSEASYVASGSVEAETLEPVVPPSDTVLETRGPDDNCIIVENGKQSKVDRNVFGQRVHSDDIPGDVPNTENNPNESIDLCQKDTNDLMQTTILSSVCVVPSSSPSANIDACEPPLVTKPPSKGGKDTTKSQAQHLEVESSEVASSCVSEAMSIETIEEQRGEIENEAPVREKKIRRKRKTVPDCFVKEKSPDRQKMKIGDLLFWNPQQNFMPGKKKSSIKKEAKPNIVTIDDDKVKDDDESTNQSEAMPAPQVMIGPDGSIVLNNESLMIRNEKKVGDTPMEIVEEDADDRYLNYGTYRKHKRAKIWSEKETQMFYLSLSMCGTDFSLITQLMPHRSRKDLTNKFRREEKRNVLLIDKALASRRPFDLKPFEKVEDLTKPKPKLTSKVTQKKSESKKDVSKDSVKDMKKETVAGKVQKKPPKKKKPKKKEPISEDEEDVWPSDSDFEIIEEDIDNSPHKMNASNMKTEATTTNKDTESITTENEEPVSPKMKQASKRTHSKKNVNVKSPQEKTSTFVEPSAADELSSFHKDSGIQAIPGSTQIQIDMGEKVMQGVLIPSKMVPVLAPQLGIDNVTEGMQVVLVQEESASGSLVHVYIIPEGEGEIIPNVAGASMNTPSSQRTRTSSYSDFDPTSPSSVTFTPAAEADRNSKQTPRFEREDLDFNQQQETMMQSPYSNNSLLSPPEQRMSMVSDTGSQASVPTGHQAIEEESQTCTCSEPSLDNQVESQPSLVSNSSPGPSLNSNQSKVPSVEPQSSPCDNNHDTQTTQNTSNKIDPCVTQSSSASCQHSTGPYPLMESEQNKSSGHITMVLPTKDSKANPKPKSNYKIDYAHI